MVMAGHRGVDTSMTGHRGVDTSMTGHGGVDTSMDGHRGVDTSMTRSLAWYSYQLGEQVNRLAELPSEQVDQLVGLVLLPSQRAAASPAGRSSGLPSWYLYQPNEQVTARWAGTVTSSACR
ncbi:hypothetical protein PCANC_15123 [Puccinia coronata f. sp. avenae]|uniref:Uncharacterized protein n=1 Tax=Puccinia coronata f. sp. avenae TaxID=200324 RepID=A0A2N5SR12_9BASI|nr:hypothetical protein PCANC_15123 [Puccinia coronata f. sp. avenae]